MKSYTLLLLLSGMLLLLPGRASAADCQSDADCANGQICQQVPCAAPQPACDPGSAECPPDQQPACPEGGQCVEAWNSQCVADADCPAGWVCQVIGGSSCPGTACADGAECPDPEPCQPQEVRGCVPPPPPSCTTDADCAGGLVCVSYTFSTCAGTATASCAAGQDCSESAPSGSWSAGGSGVPGAAADQPAPDACQEQTEGYCVPPYVAPCHVDADCGGGFRCVEEELCSCSGGAATGSGAAPQEGAKGGSGDASASADGVPDGCSCQGDGNHFCELVPTDCASDADCAAGLSCVELPTVETACAEPAAGSGEPACPDAAQPAAPVKQCVPSGWDVWGQTTPEDAQAAGLDEGATRASNNPYNAPVASTVGQDGVGGATRASEAAGASDGADGGAKKSSSSGCALAGAGSSSWSGLALLLGLTLAGRWLRREV